MPQNPSNWISKRIRHRIYKRDHFNCTFCAQDYDAGPFLSLDHVVARARGGALKDPKNLITACISCNSSKGKKPLAEFYRWLEETRGEDAEDVRRRVRRRRTRTLPPLSQKEKEMFRRNPDEDVDQFTSMAVETANTMDRMIDSFEQSDLEGALEAAHRAAALIEEMLDIRDDVEALD